VDIVSRMSSCNEFAETPGLLADVKAYTRDGLMLTRGANSSLINQQRYGELDVLAQHVSERTKELKARVVRLSDGYKRMREVQTHLNRARMEELVASQRIISELDSIRSESIRIAEELKYILCEKQKYSCKASKDGFQRMPFPDIVSASSGFSNFHWQEAYSKLS
jgi:hypothetical protein